MSKNYYDKDLYKLYWKKRIRRRKIIDRIKILLLMMLTLLIIVYIATRKKDESDVTLISQPIKFELVDTTPEPIAEPEPTYQTITKENVYEFDLREPSKLNEFVLESYLDKFPEMRGLAKHIINVQEQYGVNGIFVLAIIHLESGNCTSSLAKSHNNLGGIKANNGKYRYFESKAECIDYIGRLLSKYYLNENGTYFNGYTISAVNKRYCELDNWTGKVAQLMLQVQEGLDRYVY